MIVVNRGGMSYKHKEPASVGEIWCSNYDPQLVCVTALYNHGNGPTYINLCMMEPNTEDFGMHLVDFYATFHKVPAPAAANHK